MKIIITEQQNEQLNRKIRFSVEKLGLKQAREIFGDEIIKQTYSDNPLSYLDQFSKLSPIEKDEFVFYVDKDNLPLFATKKHYIEQGYGVVYISPARIWSFFRVVMGFDDSSEIAYNILKWLKDKYNLELKPTIYNIPILVMVHWNEPVN
jgi:hypothetical protein